ncbi:MULTISPECIES: DedA family protein [Arthrobacter]|uniref:DedA family protein n=1 Tax=Arthrobacter terricola TaxID=2547396 RepID=A0A4R5KPB5_9MICC|nr:MULTISPECIES: DedA family protein [Arthrobacter]MBT8161238.1 DedA family protein [Arthrobacter sp. GN70]TDF96480.1 DedA family protein [Arthrobacter terricola]
MQAINDFILAAAGQPWVLLLVFACCLIDGFFPPIPSESVVVGLAAVSATAGVPNAWSLILVGALGAFAGDNLAYLIGRKIGVRRWRWMRSQRMQGAFRWAGRELRRRAASLIMVARFIPIGRVAVNLTAGATRFSHGTFVALTALSAVMWASYSVAIGVFFGQWFEHNHVLGAVIAIIAAVILGIVVDRVISKVRGPLPAESEDADEPGETEAESVK